MCRSLIALIAGALVLGACDDGSGTGDPDDATTPVVDGGPADAAGPDMGPPAPAFCEGATAQRYDPFGSTEIEVFPDDLLTVADVASPTGRRLALDRTAWLDEMPPLIRDSIEEMDALSGFAHIAPIVLRFTAPLAPRADDVAASIDDASLMLFDLDADPPARVPYMVRASEGGATLLVQPARPLRPGALHGLVLTTDAADAEGDCVAPSVALQQILTGEADDPRLLEVAPAYADLLEAAELAPDAVSAATVFTTHRDTDVLFAIADRLAEHPAEWVQPPSCDSGELRRCEGLVRLWDYRDDRAVLTPEPVATWDVPVTLWLPEPSADPRPAFFMGHGFISSRREAARVAGLPALYGVAVVSMDALVHNEHPTADPSLDQTLQAAAFLGVQIAGLKADSRVLTGHFDQTVLDRLQLIDLLRRVPDLDGDGQADIDPDRIGYYGISLGGMMGPALLALDPRIELGVLQVPGGLLANFVTGSGPAEQFRPLLVGLVGGEDRFDRLLPLVQTAIDRADPATWGPLAMGRAGGPPHVLMQVSTFDTVVPPVAGIALARAMALPHLGEVIESIDLLEVQSAPASLNLPGGQATGGFTQFDRVGPPQEPMPSDHGNLPFDVTTQRQVRAFVGPWLDGETPIVIDAYGERGVQPLPADP